MVMISFKTTWNKFRRVSHKSELKLADHGDPDLGSAFNATLVRACPRLGSHHNYRYLRKKMPAEKKVSLCWTIQI